MKMTSEHVRTKVVEGWLIVLHTLLKILENQVHIRGYVM